MSSEKDITPRTLRGWGLPHPGDSKYSRGQVVVLGGAARSPGAAILAGEAALRVGAGRLTLAVGESVAASVGTALPETGVIAIPETDGVLDGDALAAAADDLRAADAILVGPGLDDIDQTESMLAALAGLHGDRSVLILDAYALGALARRPALRDGLPERLILTPNLDEAKLLLDVERDPDLPSDVVAIAEKYSAAVTCYGHLAGEDGRWRVTSGGTGLGTSGSGDVLAGAVAGFAARGLGPLPAAGWGTYLHAAAGDRLADTIGPIGYLARDLLPELTRVLADVGR